MKIEELLDKAIQEAIKCQPEITRTQILSLFSTLEEKVKELEERNDALNKCLEINQDDYAKMKSFNEKQNASLKTQVEGLKCCGNCTGWKEAGLCLDAGCDADGCCDNWQSTILTKGERHE